MKLRDMKKFVDKSLCLLFASSALLGMTGCHKDVNTGNDKIGFTVDIETVNSAKQSAPTRAGETASKAQFVAGDRIGLWVVPYSRTSADGLSDVTSALRPIDNYEDNVAHTYSNGAFTPSKVIYYPNAVTKIDMYGVYPYDATMSDRTSNSMTDPTAFSFAIAQDQSTTAGADVIKSDFMSGYCHGAKQGADGNLIFRHRMSRVLVIFNLMSSYKGYTVAGVKSVKICGVPLKSTINIADTSVSPTIVADSNPLTEITAYKAVTPTGTIDGIYTYEAIVTPGTVVAQDAVLVKVLLDVQGLGDVEFQSKAPSQITFAHKTQSNINVSLSDEVDIDFASVTIEGWGAPIEYNGVTTKLSNMYISCEAESGAGINDTGVSASLLIQGDYFTATAKYDATNQRYHLQYDHKSNFGGYLQGLEMKNAAGTTIFTATVPTPLQIKGNPTLDNYSTIIGKLIFKTDSSVEIVKL